MDNNYNNYTRILVRELITYLIVTAPLECVNKDSVMFQSEYWFFRLILFISWKETYSTNYACQCGKFSTMNAKLQPCNTVKEA